VTGRLKNQKSEVGTAWEGQRCIEWRRRLKMTREESLLYKKNIAKSGTQGKVNLRDGSTQAGERSEIVHPDA
jgi:hypothetical protein